MESLTLAERIARLRRVNLRSVTSEGLRVHSAPERSDQVLDIYHNAFSGFADNEMAILDGIILEPAAKR